VHGRRKRNIKVTAIALVSDVWLCQIKLSAGVLIAETGP
jgi:hypothetical protein